jgi:hypothetical protein
VCPQASFVIVDSLDPFGSTDLSGSIEPVQTVRAQRASPGKTPHVYSAATKMLSNLCCSFACFVLKTDDFMFAAEFANSPMAQPCISRVAP